MSIRGCGLALAALLVLPGTTTAQELKLTLDGGRATLIAHNASLRQILAEWERIGQTKIPNRDRIPESLVTLNLVDVPEASALSTLLRSGSGYMAVARPVPIPNTSNFRAVLLMAAAPVRPASGLPPSSRGDQSSQFQPNNLRFQVPGGPVNNQGMQAPGRGAASTAGFDADPQDDDQPNEPPRQQNQGPFQMRVVGPNGQIITLPGSDPRAPRGDPADSQPGAAQPTVPAPLVPTVPGAATRPGQVVPAPPTKPPGGPGAPTRPPG